MLNENTCTGSIDIIGYVLVPKPKTIFIAENIRYFRKQKKLSQTELAYELQMSVKTVGAHERGRHEPDIITIKRYCDFFETTAHVFLFKDLSK